jgi:hypothetical protein
MENNNEQLLIVVYWCDLPQFKLFCYSINQFWKGNKKIKIVITTKVHKEHNKDTTRVNKNKIVKEVLETARTYLKDWKYDIVVRNEITWAGGWNEQQVLKVFDSAKCSEEHIIVFDCKDVLFKDLYYYDFIDQNKNYLITIAKNVKEEHHSSYKYWNLKHLKEFFPENLTPWIWNRYDLQDYIIEIQKKEKIKFRYIEFYPGNFEIENYFVYLRNIKKTAVSRYSDSKNLIHAYPPFEDDYTEPVQISRYVENYHKIIKVHRNYFSNNKYVNFIAKFLIENNFPNDLIGNWKKENTEYLENWKSHTDLEFYYYKDRNKYSCM